MCRYDVPDFPLIVADIVKAHPPPRSARQKLIDAFLSNFAEFCRPLAVSYIRPSI